MKIIIKGDKLRKVREKEREKKSWPAQQKMRVKTEKGVHEEC